ncbi:MAG: hypothetical protein ACKVQR_09805 [Aquabacterium sp.]
MKAWKRNLLLRRQAAAWTAVAVGALWVAGCASFGPGDIGPGSTRDALEARLGPPHAVHDLPGRLRRLEYNTGPYGRHTWMADVDVTGRILALNQVMAPAFYDRVAAGMTQAELLRLLGRPVHRIGKWRNGQIWSWRYPGFDCLWYRVELDAASRVEGGGHAPDPACDGDNDQVR